MKKIFLPILTILSVFMLAACGGAGNTPEKTVDEFMTAYKALEFEDLEKNLSAELTDEYKNAEWMTVDEWDEEKAYVGLNGEKGYFKYVGTGQQTVEIPHIIQGIEMTSYYKMFAQHYSDKSSRDFNKIISTNRNITSTNAMFEYSQATTLDLSSFNTSKVGSMQHMFYNSLATKGYARTQTDANRLNSSPYKSSTLTFTTK